MSDFGQEKREGERRNESAEETTTSSDNLEGRTDVLAIHMDDVSTHDIRLIEKKDTRRGIVEQSSLYAAKKRNAIIIKNALIVLAFLFVSLPLLTVSMSRFVDTKTTLSEQHVFMRYMSVSSHVQSDVPRKTDNTNTMNTRFQNAGMMTTTRDDDAFCVVQMDNRISMPTVLLSTTLARSYAEHHGYEYLFYALPEDVTGVVKMQVVYDACWIRQCADVFFISTDVLVRYHNFSMREFALDPDFGDPPPIIVAGYDTVDAIRSHMGATQMSLFSDFSAVEMVVHCRAPHARSFVVDAAALAKGMPSHRSQLALGLLQRQERWKSSIAWNAHILGESGIFSRHITTNVVNGVSNITEIIESHMQEEMDGWHLNTLDDAIPFNMEDTAREMFSWEAPRDETIHDGGGTFCVVQMDDRTKRPFVLLSTTLARNYAEKHGYEYLFYKPRGSGSQALKPQVVFDACFVQGCDDVFFLDSDAFIENDDIAMREFASDPQFGDPIVLAGIDGESGIRRRNLSPEDANGMVSDFNTGQMVVHCHAPRARSFLADWVTMATFSGNDQPGLGIMYRQERWKSEIVWNVHVLGYYGSFSTHFMGPGKTHMPDYVTNRIQKETNGADNSSYASQDSWQLLALDDFFVIPFNTSDVSVLRLIM